MESQPMLLAVCLTWILIIALPGYDKSSPLILITSGQALPLTELLSLLIFAVHITLHYELFRRCCGGQLSHSQQLTVTFLIAVTACGIGSHFAWATVQSQMMEDNSIYPLVDFLHERLSHHLLFGGWFSLVLYTAWCDAGYTQQRIDNSKEPVLHYTYTVASWLVNWALPIAMGIFFNVVAPPTYTEHVVTLFNVGVVSMVCILYWHQSRSVKNFVVDSLSQMTIISFFTKSALVSTAMCLVY